MTSKGRRNHPSGGPEREIDLHGRPPEAALRFLGQQLHAARVAGARGVRVVTGRGWGNREQRPVLRGKVEAWLRGPDGRRLGVSGFEIVSKGGALDVRFGPPAS
jgi:DNA-nicking Smr family endonuclease